MTNLPKRVQLSLVHPGQHVEVVKVSGHPDFRKRMLSLGVTPKSQLHVLRQMPLGGPLEIEVRGTQMAIRKADAAFIEVDVLTEMPSKSVIRNRENGGAFA